MRYSLLIFLFAIGAVKSQSFTATWNFNGNTNSASSSAQVSAGNAALNNVDLSGYPAGCNGDALAIFGWKAIFQADEYTEVSVTPSAGYQLSLSNISVNVFRSGSGPTNIYLRSNQDGFASDLASGGVSTGCGGFGTGLSFNNRTSTVTFRFYTSGASAGLGNIKFDDLVISGTVSPVALPVSLSVFRVVPNKKQVEIAWETVWEKNNDYFEVQRSQNAEIFETLATKNSLGNGTERNRYAFIDPNPPSGLLYYRLKQVDFDGNRQYSKVIIVKTESALNDFFVENPVRNQEIVLRKLERFDTLLLLSNEGNAIEMLVEKRGENIRILPERMLPAGIYFLRIGFGNEIITKRLLVE